MSERISDALIAELDEIAANERADSQDRMYVFLDEWAKIAAELRANRERERQLCADPAYDPYRLREVIRDQQSEMKERERQLAGEREAMREVVLAAADMIEPFDYHERQWLTDALADPRLAAFRGEV